jgi:hypothetical protein
VITIKVSSRGSGKDLDISQYLGNAEGRWGECVFHVNTNLREADVWFIQEDVDDDDTECSVREGGLFFLTAETSWPEDYYSGYPERIAVLEQFDRVLTPHSVPLANVTSSIPFLPWMVNANHGTSINAPHVRDLHVLEAIPVPTKPRELSVFCSAQTLTPGHRARLSFTEKLKEHFGDRLDWFGNGINPIDEKWDGIAPYRSTIVLENRSTPLVITEKLADAYLGFSYPFYWGAPDVGGFVPPGSFTAIDLRDVSGTIAIIEEELAAGVPEAARPAVARARQWVLRDWNPYARMAALAHDVVSSGSSRRTRSLATMASAHASDSGRSLWNRLTSAIRG